MRCPTLSGKEKIMNSNLMVLKALFFCSIVLGLSFSFASFAHAVIANDEPYFLTQPGGEKFQARLRGDEWHHWIENGYGYAVAKGKDGVWYYLNTSQYTEYPLMTTDEVEAVESMEMLTETPAHEPPPPGLKPYRPPQTRRPDLEAESENDMPAYIAPRRNFDGNLLLILVQFNDQKGKYPPGNWGNDSFRPIDLISTYFKKASYGKVNLKAAEESSGTKNDGVIGWLNISNQLKKLEIQQNVSDQSGNHPNTGAQGDGGRYVMLNRLIAKAAILCSDPYINYAKYDADGNGIITPDELAVQIVVAGYEAGEGAVPAGGKSVWAHKFFIPASSVGLPVVDKKKISIYSMVGEIHNNPKEHQATYGVMVHELGHHIFNWPDLYNTKTKGTGIGPWDVMATGSWGRTAAQKFDGQTPVLPSAWTKKFSGWTMPQDPTAFPDGIVELTAVGSLSATRANSAAIAKDSLREYFLVENRQNVGYDKGLEGRLKKKNWNGGIAIWHVDETVKNNKDDTHRMVSLEGANGAEGVWISYYSDDVLWRKGGEDAFWFWSNPDNRIYDGKFSRWVVVDIGESSSKTSARIVEAGGLKVMLEPPAAVGEGAQWKISRGPVSTGWLNSGVATSWVPEETTVEFKPVAGWQAPASRKVVLQPMQTTEVTATYTKGNTDTIAFGGTFQRKDWRHRDWNEKAQGTISGPKITKVKDQWDDHNYWVVWFYLNSPYYVDLTGSTVSYNLELESSGKVNDTWTYSYKYGGEDYEEVYKITKKQYRLHGGKAEVVNNQCAFKEEYDTYSADGKFTVDATITSIKQGSSYLHCHSNHPWWGIVDYTFDIETKNLTKNTSYHTTESNYVILLEISDRPY